MAIIETKRQSDLEKRLKLLHQQVYGKNQYKSAGPRRGGQLTTESYSATSDITYLHQDLLRILTLSSAAIGVQLVLFILSKNYILNLNFF